jgi:flagella basal body P-ring formation protein FlgA
MAGVAAAVLASMPFVAAENCVTIVHPIRAGQALIASDIKPAAVCANHSKNHALRYDRTVSVTRANRDLDVGETISGHPSLILADVRPGDDLFVYERIGNVLIERAAKALQAGRYGGEVFVRTADGAIFAAALKDLRR